MSELWGTREPEHPLHPSLGLLGGGWMGRVVGAGAQHDGPVEWGPVHDLQGQVWGYPTHVAPPDSPGMCPTAPLSITSIGETPSITTVVGGLLILECPEVAVPPPYIEWHREGSPLRVRVMGPGTVHGQGLGCTFTSPVRPPTRMSH